MKNSWHVVSNAQAGQGRAKLLADDLVRQLSEHGIHYILHETQCEGDGLRIGRGIVAADKFTQDGLTVAVVGGDGTLHELINGITPFNGTFKYKVNLAVVPAGTANAVYHSLFPSTAADDVDSCDRFLSVKAALSPSSSSKVPLSIMKVTPAPSSNSDIFSHVVTSTALHAHILETASTAEMRKAYPGVERFKRAAEQHIGTVYQAKLTLKPRKGSGGAGIQQWSIRNKQWVHLSHNEVVLEGKFTYLVSALVDRFEAKFLIAPHSSIQTRPGDAVDIVLVRMQDGQGKDQAVRTLTQVLTAAYDHGKHILLTEPKNEADDLETEGAGKAVVEYYRVAGFDWKPVRESIQAP